MSFYSDQIPWRANDLLNKYDSPLSKRGAGGFVEQLKAGIKHEASVKEASGLKRYREIHQAAVKFESIFLKELLKIMRKTVPKSGFLNGGWTEEFYWDMLNQELSDCMARAGGIGLAKMIYQQMSRPVE